MKLTQNNNTFTLTGEIECTSCNASGLYKGMAEQDGAAVICYNCNGSGSINIKQTYTKFTKRTQRKDVKRVYDSSHGYVISSKDVTTTDNKNIKFSQAGTSYKEWLNGSEPKPIKDLICPYQHSNQNMQSKSHKWNNYFKKECNKCMPLGGRISDCTKFNSKHNCWNQVEQL